MWSGSTPFICRIGQHGVDHRRRPASIGVDRARQFLLAQMAQDDLVDEAGFPVPSVIRLRVRQRRHKFEILQLAP